MNPTLTSGFEDIITHIKQLEQRVMGLEEENKKLEKENKELKELKQQEINEVVKSDEGTIKLLSDMVSLMGKVETLEEENKKLKEENEKVNKRIRNFVIQRQKVRKLDSESHQKKGDHIMKLEKENKELKEENERMLSYLESREIKYCDKCRKYGDYDEGYGDFVYNDDTCQYICHECS